MAPAFIRVYKQHILSFLSSFKMAAAAPLSYAETIAAIKAECAHINLSYSGGGDGRITSAVKETEYLTALKTGLATRWPTVTFEMPKERYWYDVRINNIPINLKLTTGGTDNAFNKVAIIYTLTGVEVANRNMNYNAWFRQLRELPKKAARDPASEYHYLAVDKATGSVLLKSILDIHAYKTNPCNILQINWKHEFSAAALAYSCADHNAKAVELLGAVQSSIRQSIASMREFAEADLRTFGTSAVGAGAPGDE